MEAILYAVGHSVALTVEAIAIVVIATGTVEAVGNTIRIMRAPRVTGADRRTVWLDFAGWLVAALTFQLAADISMPAPQMREVHDRCCETSAHRRGKHLATAPNRRATSESSSGDIATELAARRTGMSFQRTRMSADRTLMSVIRTALSLIGFGFTIYQVFQKLLEAQVLRSAGAPR